MPRGSVGYMWPGHDVCAITEPYEILNQEVRGGHYVFESQSNHLHYGRTGPFFDFFRGSMGPGVEHGI